MMKASPSFYLVPLMTLASWLTGSTSGLSAAAAQEPVARQEAGLDDSAASSPSTGVARAESLSEQAYEAYQKQDYAAAVTLYEQAYAAAPSADILYNIAKVYDGKLLDRAQALAYYERYIEHPEAVPERVRTAQQRSEVLRALMAAEGEQKTGHAQASGLAQAESKRALGRASEEHSVPPPSGITRMRLTGVVLTTLGVSGLVLGAGFGLAARSHADRAHALCDGNACVSQRGVSAADDATRSANVSTIAFCVGGALSLLGLGLWVWGRPSARERDESHHSASSKRALGRASEELMLVPQVQRGALGTQIAGRW